VSFREDMQKGRDIFTTGKRIVAEKEANSQSKDKPQHLSYTLVTYNLTEQTLSQKKKKKRKKLKEANANDKLINYKK
jgi:hypothetical protein